MSNESSLAADMDEDLHSFSSVGGPGRPRSRHSGRSVHVMFAEHIRVTEGMVHESGINMHLP